MAKSRIACRILLCSAALAVTTKLAAVHASGQEIDMAGLQLWNTDYWKTVEIGDYYGPNFHIGKLQPIRMVGFRNGVFSGQVVVTCSTRPMTGLQAAVTDLKHERADAAIPKTRLRVRYPELSREGVSWNMPYRFDRLLDTPPEDNPIVDMRSHRGWKPQKVGPVAMQPIWVTVSVPSNAVPGLYTGVLTVTEDDNSPLTVPVQIEVHGWTLPPPQEYNVIHNLWSNPDRVARHYEVEMWSDRHFELLRRSLEKALPLGSRHIEANFVARYASRDNPDTMVKWVRQTDGSFTYDFTAFDRYMDLAADVIGNPYPIRLNFWSASPKDPPHSVIVVDAATGERELMEQPAYGTEESYAFWKPVLDETRKRLEQRGWFKNAGVGWHAYSDAPDPAMVEVLYRIWPDAVWISLVHGRHVGFWGPDRSIYMPSISSSTVWNEPRYPLPRGYRGGVTPLPELMRAVREHKAGERPSRGATLMIRSGHARGQTREWSDLWRLRGITEEQLMKNHHGVDPLGIDLWPAKLIRGRRISWVSGSFQAAALGPGNCTRAITGPGPNGAIATERYEAFREGVQIGEVILFIQRALDSGKLTPDLTAKADRVLDERSDLIMEAWPQDKTPTQSRGQEVLQRDRDPSVLMAKSMASERALYAVAAEIQGETP